MFARTKFLTNFKSEEKLRFMKHSYITHEKDCSTLRKRKMVGGWFKAR